MGARLLWRVVAEEEGDGENEATMALLLVNMQEMHVASSCHSVD